MKLLLLPEKDEVTVDVVDRNFKVVRKLYGGKTTANEELESAFYPSIGKE